MARALSSAPLVGIIMGSQSDWETMVNAADTLKKLGVPAAHLPGMVAAMTSLPVMGVPVQSKTLDGIDSLLSIVQMPAGIPVHTFAIGRAGAINAALGAAAVLALSDAKLAKKLDTYRAEQTKAVLDNPIPGRKGKKR